MNNFKTVIKIILIYLVATTVIFSLIEPALAIFSVQYYIIIMILAAMQKKVINEIQTSRTRFLVYTNILINVIPILGLIYSIIMIGVSN